MHFLLTSIGFTNFLRCLIFEFLFFTNADVVTIKDETSKENLWNQWKVKKDLHRFQKFSLDGSSLIVTTLALVNKKSSKMRHLKKFVKAMEVNGTSCSLIWPASVSRIFFRCLIFNCYNISICKKEKFKDETSKKTHETNGGQIKEHWPKIPCRYVHQVNYLYIWQKLHLKISTSTYQLILLPSTP